jgi:hypothetical protein
MCTPITAGLVVSVQNPTVKGGGEVWTCSECQIWGIDNIFCGSKISFNGRHYYRMIIGGGHFWFLEVGIATASIATASI